ncbi:HutD family protein [Streptomyces sp. NPDC048297]|uniref:HutD/Ves family protein n=1 Tax=Streptomyces sp. NPDC048297 TaxID=3365531 RepID=UPI00372409A3
MTTGADAVTEGADGAGSVGGPVGAGGTDGAAGAGGVTGGRVLRAQDRPATPWKNGGGLTREVAADDSTAGLDDFVWRVSLADVAGSGPFSAFAGVDRIITVVDGAGMELTVDGAVHTVAAPYEPFPFPGDAATGCRLLDGPIVDFNVMTRRSRAWAHVRMEREDFAVEPRSGVVVLAVVLQGTATVAESGVTLGRFDAVQFSGDDAGTLRVDGVTAIVTVLTTDCDPSA